MYGEYNNFYTLEPMTGERKMNWVQFLFASSSSSSTSLPGIQILGYLPSSAEEEEAGLLNNVPKLYCHYSEEEQERTEKDKEGEAFVHHHGHLTARIWSLSLALSSSWNDREPKMWSSGRDFSSLSADTENRKRK